MALPDGYDTVIGEGGSSLSGGEKQRISIARAMLKDAPIVILDEATASIDPENEHLIQEAISALTHGKTIITIAHRLATIEMRIKFLSLMVEPSCRKEPIRNCWLKGEPIRNLLRFGNRLRAGGFNNKHKGGTDEDSCVWGGLSGGYPCSTKENGHGPLH